MAYEFKLHISIITTQVDNELRFSKEFSNAFNVFLYFSTKVLVMDYIKHSF